MNNTFVKYTELKEDDPIASTPSQINIQLFNHQLRTLAYALKLESDARLRSNLGILCDDVGSGKSYIALAISANPIHHNTISYSDDCLTVNRMVKHNDVNVIVVPHSIVNQWIGYCENTSFDVCVVRSFKPNITLKEITIVSSTAYRKFADDANERGIVFKRVFYDECNTIKLPACVKMDCMFTWFISASIHELQPAQYRSGVHIPITTSKGYIHRALSSVLRYEDRHMLFVKNDSKLVRQEMTIPKYNSVTIKCSHKVGYILQQAVEQNVLTALQAGDVGRAIELLGSDTTDEDNILKIVCSSMFDQLRELESKLEYTRERHYSNVQSKEDAITRVECEIRNIKQKIDNVNARMKEVEICPISFCEIEVPVVVKCCGNKFDLESLMMYINSKVNASCPFCRIPLSKENMMVIHERGDHDVRNEEEWVCSDHTAVENTSHLIDELPNGSRILVFSNYHRTFDIIDEVRDADTISMELKGNHMVQAKTIRWFSETSEDKRILMLNSKFIGAGVNLHMATDVIITHKMDDDLKCQCIGRAQRYGRNDTLTVYTME